MRRLAPALLVLACACGDLRKDGDWGPAAVLTVEGWSADGGREAALADARREAAAVAARTHLPSETLAASAEEVEKLLAEPARFIEEERVLSEGQEEGFFKLRLEAAVLFDRMGSELVAAGLLPEPRKPGTRAALSLSGSEEALRLTAQALVDGGFEVVHRSTASLGGADGPDRALALGLARRLGVRAVVAGEATDRGGLAAGAGTSRSARVRLWALDGRSGEVLASSDQEASAQGGSPQAAAGKALSMAARVAGEELAERLLAKLPPSGNLKLKVGLVGSPADLRRLIERLRGEKGVEQVHLEFYSRDHAIMLVSLRELTSDDLAAIVLRDPHFKFDMRAVFPDEVEVERR